MSLLLVVRAGRDAAGLEGVLADEQRLEDGLRVFRRGGREVLRAPEAEAVVVRDLTRLRPSSCSPCGSRIGAP